LSFQLAVELLELAPAFLPGALLVDLHLCAARALVVGQRLGARLQLALLLLLELLLAQLLLQLQLLERLALTGVRRRSSGAPLLLLHPELQLVHLLLPQELVLLERSLRRIVCAPGLRGQEQKRQSTADTPEAPGCERSDESVHCVKYGAGWH